jgi:hypothetical protein
MQYSINYAFISRPREGWRAAGMRWLVSYTQPLYRYLSRRKAPAWELSISDLSAYPENSLGNALAQFLQTHHFTLMAQLESHDVFHVLLGYSASVLDEARMQFCLVGSGRRSLYALGTCAIASFFFPEYLRDFSLHYQRGKAMRHFSYWDFKALLAEDIVCLRKQIAPNLHISNN